MSGHDFAIILPELLLLIGVIGLLLFATFAKKTVIATSMWGCVFLLLLACLVVLVMPQGVDEAFFGAFKVDAFSRFVKLLLFGGGALCIIMSREDTEPGAALSQFEYPLLLVFATIGMAMMVSANDLIALYIGIELQSLSLYILAAARIRAQRSSEAGLKYFILGSLSSALLLYGASLIYGYCGATSFAQIAVALQSGPIGLGVLFGLAFLAAGMAFKLSAVPFHMWTPDVYEGAATPVTAFFAATPKIAALALLTRLVIEPFAPLGEEWRQILFVIAASSMLLGAVAAIGQTNIKRLMAYSSIGHMGYALVGLASGTMEGVQAILVYLTIYLVMTIGAFSCILSMRQGDLRVENISDLAGQARKNRYFRWLWRFCCFRWLVCRLLPGFSPNFMFSPPPSNKDYICWPFWPFWPAPSAHIIICGSSKSCIWIKQKMISRLCVKIMG